MRKFKPFYSFLRYSYASPDVLGSFLLEESQANKGSSRFQLRSGKELSDTFGCFDGFEVPVATQTKNPVSTKSFFSQLKEEPIFWQLTELLWTCTCMLQAAAEGSSPARSRTSFKAGSGHPAPRPAADGGRLPAAGDPPADGLPGEDSALVPVGISRAAACARRRRWEEPGSVLTASQQVPGCLPRCTTWLWMTRRAGGQRRTYRFRGWAQMIYGEAMDNFMGYLCFF